MMDTILVTGGLGFIGSTYIRESYSLETMIINLDAMTYAGNPKNLPGFDENLKNYQFIHGDIRDELLVKKIFDKYDPDIVIHFAAESHVTRSEKNPDLFWDVNVNGTKNLLNRFSKKNGFSLFVHISTDEVYGPASKRTSFKETAPIGESVCSSPYSNSKAMADKIAQRYLDNDKNVVILRPTNNFGSFQSPEKFLPRTIIKCIYNNPIEVWGNGTQIRDWLWSVDTVTAINTVINLGVAPGVYNIGANQKPEINNLTMAKYIAKRLNYKNTINLIEDPRPNHDQRYSVNTNKFKQETGWMPLARPPWNAIDETIDWYQDNAYIWKNLYKESEKLYK